MSVIGTPIITGGVSKDLISGSIIQVTTDEGSVVTISRGREHQTAIVSSSGVVSFTVFNSGHWTITATKITQVETLTDYIDVVADNTTYAKTMHRMIDIYNAGDQCSSVTGGWSNMDGAGGYTVFEATRIHMDVSASSGRDTSCFTVNTVSSGNYTKLKCNYSCASNMLFKFGFISEKRYAATFVSYVQLPAGSNLTGELAISSQINDAYIGFHAGIGYGIYITRVWLEA